MDKREFKGWRLLDSWQFWVGVAYFGLALVVIALWVNYDRVSADQKRTAIITAERIADTQSQYVECVKSIPLLKRVNTFFDGEHLLGQTLIKNSIANHQATPPGTPLYRAQIANLERLRKSLSETTNVHISVPTKKQCNLLRLKRDSPSQ
jgi:hypothetical protein